MDVWRKIAFIWLIANAIIVAHGGTVRSFPRYDYEGKDHEQFIQAALGRSSPGSARLLAELFGGLEIDLEMSDSQAIITVGGAATRCQHQSPCYDSKCKACYDPLLRIHGKCGGASYFTCRGSLPKVCMPYTCTYKGLTTRSGEPINDEPVFVKKFARFEDTFCLGNEEKARSLEMSNDLPINMTRSDLTKSQDDPEWVMPVPDAVTPCKGYDTCLHLECGKCYDPYLGAHTTCGKLSYYDCRVGLPQECRPVSCTDSNVNEIFPMSEQNAEPRSADNEPKFISQLMVRDFAPLQDGRRNCSPPRY